MRLGKLSPILFVGLSLLTAVPALFLRAEESAASLRATRSRQAAEERMAYAKSPAYNPYDTQAGDAGKAISQRLERGETTAAIADATAALAQAPYDINLLMLLASAYRDAGNTAKADETRDRWIALVDSIIDSGDGRSFQTAFKVISVHEEYAIIRILRLQTAGQSLVTHEGSSFDVMKVRPQKSDETFEIYFNIDLPHSWLQRQFGAAK